MKICCNQNQNFIMYYKVTIFTCTNVHHAAKAAANLRGGPFYNFRATKTLLWIEATFIDRF